MGFSPSFFVGVGRERFENSLPCHPLIWIRTGSGDCSDHLIWIRTGSGDCSDHLIWIRTGSGGYKNGMTTE